MATLTFSPICGTCKSVNIETAFNDKRLGIRYSKLFNSMVNNQSNVTYQISEDLKTAISNYRFYRNNRVNMEELIDQGCQRTIELSKDRELLVIGDTTEINLLHQYEDIVDKERVGKISDNKTPGILAHVHMAVDAHSGQGIGIGDLILWSRNYQPESQDGKKDSRSFEEKESYKWVLGMKNCVARFGNSQPITFIFDKEADNFEVLRVAEQLGVDVLLRTHYQRQVSSSQSKEQSKIDSFLASLPFVCSYELTVKKRKPSRHARRKPKNLRQGRPTSMQVRFGKCQVHPPIGISHPPIDIYVVEALEEAGFVPEGERPIRWRITTTHQIETEEQAMEVLARYEQRWHIEQLFRTMKKKGFRIEETELEYLDSIYKQTIMSFFAAFQVMQLILERDQLAGRKITELFNDQEIRWLGKLNEKYQGNTLKQKNPYPPDRLSWACWIIARMGGWKGLASQGKPGPLTFKRGIERLNNFFEAWNLLNPN